MIFSVNVFEACNLYSQIKGWSIILPMSIITCEFQNTWIVDGSSQIGAVEQGYQVSIFVFIFQSYFTFTRFTFSTIFMKTVPEILMKRIITPGIDLGGLCTCLVDINVLTWIRVASWVWDHRKSCLHYELEFFLYHLLTML